MQVPDAFRAQYYLPTLEKEIAFLKQDVGELPFFVDWELWIDKYVSALSISIDQILLPTLVYEIHKLKEEKKIVGLTASGRYKNFFVQNGAYTAHARGLFAKYPFLFETIDCFIQASFRNLKNCLLAFSEDRTSDWFPNEPIAAIDILESSDRHRSQQSLVLVFQGGSRVIYKPVDLFPDLLLREFITSLGLSSPYDLQCLDVLPKQSYGWIRFLSAQNCGTVEEVKNYYQRMGVLLAVADALNYTDGHCENVFAYGAYPILLDGETLFQNYAPQVAEQKNILSTLFVQKLDPDLVICSALQETSSVRYEGFYTYAINDRTDAIEIKYMGISKQEHHHMPCYQGEYKKAIDFKRCIIDGYRFGFDCISSSVDKIMSNESWWNNVASVKVRLVLRGTSAYSYLLRRIQHHDLISCKEKAEGFLKEQLGDTIYTHYEARDLLAMNIPYFYHYPGERHLFDGENDKYCDIFSYSAVEHMKKQLLNRTQEYREFNCEILRKNLI